MKKVFVAEMLELGNQIPEGSVFILEAKTDDLRRKAMEVAVQWLDTEEGKAFREERRAFTWTDLIVTIPKDFCKEKGLSVTLVTERPEFVIADQPIFKKVENIKWDTDGEDISHLPDKVIVPGDIEDDDVIDYLSDFYGFCVFSADIFFA